MKNNVNLLKIKTKYMKSKLNLDIDKIEFTAKRFRVIVHPARIQIIKLLLEYESLNVTQILTKLNMNQAETSIHLTIFKKYGIAKSVKQGKMRIYSLNTKLLEDIVKISEDLSKK